MRRSLDALPRPGTAVALQSAAAKEARRLAAGVQQRLDSVAPSAGLSEIEGAAVDLLGAAAEDASWAWRMVQAGDLGPGPGAAVRALDEHARTCCDEVARLLGATSPEPLEGPREA